MRTPAMNKGTEPAIGIFRTRSDDDFERQGGRDGDDEAICPDLRHGDFERRDRHDEQMIHCAMLALANDGRARQNDREHRHIIDDAHDAREPRRHDIWIEDDAHGERDRRFSDVLRSRKIRPLVARDEIVDLGRQDLLDITVAKPGRDHGRRIDIDLNLRAAARRGRRFSKFGGITMTNV